MAISPQKSLKALIYRSRNNGKVKTVVGAVPMAQTGRTLQRKFAEWPYAELSSVFWDMANSKPAVQLGKVRGHPEEANSLRVYWSSTSWNQIGYQATHVKVFCAQELSRCSGRAPAIKPQNCA